MTTFDIIKKLSSDRGENIKDVAKKLGFGENLFYKWKTQSPTSDKLEAVADYFNVTTDYLLGRTTEPQLKHYDDKTFAAIAKSFKADNEAYTQLFESLPSLSDEELVVVNNMVQSLIELKQKKS
ncbi:helix-turn-helix transcriptional regulator [Enterococcus plantarum]|uniref:helix-turn-helix domain-containing protein n=1 Tax=Enterococcus plantarum TaxID=1077675 RepID=UPI000DA7D0FD|nr:transposase [Enterococcus plantarum]MBO0467900.1 helix-turn-helix transcriptional regulator [Enterococcus plantarum]